MCLFLHWSRMSVEMRLPGWLGVTSSERRVDKNVNLALSISDRYLSASFSSINLVMIAAAPSESS